MVVSTNRGPNIGHTILQSILLGPHEKVSLILGNPNIHVCIIMSWYDYCYFMTLLNSQRKVSESIRTAMCICIYIYKYKP